MTSFRILAALSAAAGIAQASDLYVQNFETAGLGYTTSVAEFSDGSGDYFTRTDGSNISSSVNYNNVDGFYFGGQDLDGEGAGLPIYLTTDTFSISGATDLQFAIDLAEDAASDGNNDWDGPAASSGADTVAFEYQLDGGAWVNMFTAQNDGSTFNSAAFVNGVMITDTFSTFSADLSALSGSTLAIRLVWDLDAGDEDLAIDNIRVTGNIAVVPLPPAAWAGIGMLGLMAGARMRRK
jgi:hypothetical protein